MQRLRIRQRGEPAYTRQALFAIEVLDGVTISRLSDGITLTAHGLRGRPVKNASGLFVWRNEDIALLERISIDPGLLPYQPRELLPSDLILAPVAKALTRVQLAPRVDYAFDSGFTGLRGTLIEERSIPLHLIRGARVHLRWLDDDGITWRDAPVASITNERGDFVTFLRVGVSEVPQVNANGAITVRVIVQRDEMERRSIDLKLPQGRVANPTTSSEIMFAWDELQP